MSQMDRILPPWLFEMLPSEHPLVTLALYALAAFLWLRIAMLLVGLLRHRPAEEDPAPPPIPVAGRRRGQDCIWREDRLRKGATSTRWICSTCGIEAYTRDGRPPKACKRDPGAATL